MEGDARASDGRGLKRESGGLDEESQRPEIKRAVLTGQIRGWARSDQEGGEQDNLKADGMCKRCYILDPDPGTLSPCIESDRRRDVNRVVVMVSIGCLPSLYNCSAVVSVLPMRMGMVRVMVRARTVEVKMRSLVMGRRPGNAHRFVRMSEADPLEEDQRNQE